MQTYETKPLMLSLNLKFSTWRNDECLPHAFNNVISLHLKYFNPLNSNSMFFCCCCFCFGSFCGVFFTLLLFPTPGACGLETWKRVAGHIHPRHIFWKYMLIGKWVQVLIFQENYAQRIYKCSDNLNISTIKHSYTKLHTWRRKSSKFDISNITHPFFMGQHW